ncbi:MAG TPA: DUF4136 domain-containing protein [Candidatus Cryosericum sp.]|nr:DUF4136 domain-containing protein [Candidatus Cryosericum sp.]
MSRTLRISITALLLPSCLATVLLAGSEVGAEYDRQADFSKYKTYSWGKKPDTGKAEADARIMEVVDAQLKTKGWERVEGGPSDAVLAAIAIIREDQQIDTAYSGWGSGWNWSGPGPLAGAATTVRTDNRVGTLVVDIFDTGTKKVVWRGTAKGTLSPEADVEVNRRKLQQAVTRLFKGFPPAKPAEPKGGS